jgi:hypothetical protein
MVAFDVGASVTLCKNGRTVALVQLQDVFALVRAIRMLIADNALRARLPVEPHDRQYRICASAPGRVLQKSVRADIVSWP